MAALEVPRNLAETARLEDPDGLREWVAELSRVVPELAEKWSLCLGDPYQPGGQCSWVAPARSSRGDDLVLKVGWRHTEAAHEAEAFRLWGGHGAVRLHAAYEWDQTSALLLERCVPGTPLGEAEPEPEQDLIVAGLLRQLWLRPPDGHPFRPLRIMCDEWTDEFEQKFQRFPDSIDRGLAREGMAMFRSLPRTAEREALLCTDLHAGNVLAARRQPWLVIDPKPYVGDPTYDALQHMLNCEDRLRMDPAGFARRMADLLDLHAGRLLAWLFARCVQESIDQPLLREVATRVTPR
ncbi:MAG: aminoglycoside phosphotransferase family protein [Streptosporangiaceae bacterium]